MLTAMSSLPAKKRRGSNASKSSVEGESSDANEALPSLSPRNNFSDTTAAMASGSSDKSKAESATPRSPEGLHESSNHAKPLKISENRLPSKKRKGSHDSNPQGIHSQSKRKGSQESSSSLRNHLQVPLPALHDSNDCKQSSQRGSGCSEMPFETDHKARKRKGSHDSNTVKFDKDTKVPAERKGSHDASVQFKEDVKSQKRKGAQEKSSTPSIDSAAEQKRKASHDFTESVLLNGVSSSIPGRKMSHDLSVQFVTGFNERKWSQDITIPSFEGVPRKDSYDSSLKLDELLPFPPPEPVSNLRHPSFNTTNTDTPSVLTGVHPTAISAMDHLKALSGANGDTAAVASKNDLEDEDSRSSSTFASSGQRILLEAFPNPSQEGNFSSGNFGSHSDTSHPTGRHRLESWGAMSDLSAPLAGGGCSDSTAAVLAHSALQHADLADDVMDAAAGLDSINDLHEAPDAIPNRISLGRERFNSVASLSEVSLSGLLFDGIEVSGDMQAFVSAAMATMGDQLEALAGAVETVANSAGPHALDALRRELGMDSDADSDASPMIGAMSDNGRHKGRPRSWSTSSGRISVDYEAVAAAVDAGEAADLSGVAAIDPSSSSISKERQRHASRRQLPLQRARGDSDLSLNSDERAHLNASLVGSSLTDDEIKRIQERARKKAGYIPPTARSKAENKANKEKTGPFKKRVKRNSPEPAQIRSASPGGTHTPKASNKSMTMSDNLPLVPDLVLSGSTAASKAAKGQASQKWESMFECLVEYVDQCKKEETKGFSQTEVDQWQWDGNVPTSYKSIDGKALGRWVNNQRSAKSKGTLKGEREQRLLDAGLKWSVLTSNSWNEMLEELRLYIKEQAAKGKKWDGNVPTNYQIKNRSNGRFAGEDKNLGRWVNRQRSQFHAGKLRKDRQLDLEKVGLKWSMLATNSWDSMYETLCEYVDQRKKEGGGWDGNVPANYRTNDYPPRALGRWINRQRSAFAKDKLKSEYVEKLSETGLKWSVHERTCSEKDDMDGEDHEASSQPSVKPEMVTSTKSNEMAVETIKV